MRGRSVRGIVWRARNPHGSSKAMGLGVMCTGRCVPRAHEAVYNQMGEISAERATGCRNTKWSSRRHSGGNREGSPTRSHRNKPELSQFEKVDALMDTH